MNSRLDTVAPGIVEHLARAEPAALRRIASTVAEYAVAGTGLSDPAVLEGLAALRGGRFGSSSARAAVKRLVESLDERYWNLQDDPSAGNANEDDYLGVFSRARAASALDFALDADPYIAASEAAYEAVAALDDIEAIRRLIDAELARQD